MPLISSPLAARLRAVRFALDGREPQGCALV
jgi:hypothetical protein